MLKSRLLYGSNSEQATKEKDHIVTMGNKDVATKNRMVVSNEHINFGQVELYWLTCKNISTCRHLFFSLLASNIFNVSQAIEEVEETLNRDTY